jgi:hypothetical protein
MQFAIVKNRKGKRVICWGPFLQVTLLMLATPAAASSAIYYLITKRWDSVALYGGLGAGAATAIVVLIFAWATPLHKMQFDTDNK